MTGEYKKYDVIQLGKNEIAFKTRLASWNAVKHCVMQSDIDILLGKMV